ncbi:MAG: YceI family protein [Thiothrix sp.]
MKQRLKLAAQILLPLLLLSQAAAADWVLDNDKSALYFVSIKKENVAETHTFKNLSGLITEAGQGSLAIDLASLETNIDIRNTRMRDHLFETSKFATATVSVDLTQTGLKPGIQTVKVILDLHGVKKEIPAVVAITEVGNTVQVASVAPVILDAAEFDLAGGLTTLREIGAVASISNAVPVTFFLSFAKQD